MKIFLLKEILLHDFKCSTHKSFEISLVINKSRKFSHNIVKMSPQQMDLLPERQIKLVLSHCSWTKDNVPELTIDQQLKELYHNNNLVQYRIDRQHKLIDKINKGKWKSSQYNTTLLESLAKLDVDILLKMKQDNEKEQIALKKQIDKGQKENDNSNINLDL